MIENNANLTPEQVRHLTRHAVIQNEDGSYSWKFDNYARGGRGPDVSPREEAELLRQIACPVLLVHGQQSWIPDPRVSGHAALFPECEVLSVVDAGHWMHHDQTGQVIAALRSFL